MIGLVETLNRFDPSLVVRKDNQGVIGVYRKVKRSESVSFQGNKLTYVKDFLTPILYSTHDWTRRGQPVQRGALNFLARLQEIDAWSRKAFFEEMERKEKLADESANRAARGAIEDHLLDRRRDFVRATSDINLGTVDKKF